VLDTARCRELTGCRNGEFRDPVVPPRGFEPPTFWFVARRYCPLSYGGVLTALRPDGAADRLLTHRV
jgi:hypothetical protein